MVGEALLFGRDRSCLMRSTGSLLLGRDEAGVWDLRGVGVDSLRADPLTSFAVGLRCCAGLCAGENAGFFVTILSTLVIIFGGGFFFFVRRTEGAVLGVDMAVVIWQ